MKILFGADLHSHREAFSVFARQLREADVGVLGGDLLDEFITRSEAEDWGLIPRDEPEELLGADEVVSDVFDRAMHDAVENPESVNRRGLRLRQQEILSELNAAGKPVFLIAGNHDMQPWPNGGLVQNIEGRRVELDGWNFVGFDHSGNDFSEATRKRALRKLRPLVDSRTLLVSHMPPFGVLDFCDNGHIGSSAVLRFVKRARPAAVLCGHVHESFGRAGNVINGAWFLSRQFVLVDTKEFA